LPVEEQIAVLYAGVNGLLKGVEVARVRDFERAFLSTLRASYKESVLEPLASGVVDEAVSEALERVAREVVESLK
jgi:F-type H+-transporting ATPase subunit alpha